MPFRHPRDLQDRFRGAVLADRLFPQASTILVGVSGRADSVALAHLLHGIADELALSLVLAHIPTNPKSSAATQEQFMEKLAQDLHASTMYVDAIQDTAATPRAHALNLLAALERVRARARATSIATGETSDDVAEQFLSSLVYEDDALQETSLTTNGTIVRPLLPFTHAETLAFLTDKGIPFQTDQEALALGSREQKIRLLILPVLQRHLTRDAITNLAAAAQVTMDDRSFVKEVARAARTEVGWVESAGGLTLDHARWSALPAALRRRVLTDALEMSLPAVTIPRAVLLSLDTRCRHLADFEATEFGTLKIRRSNGMLTVVHI
jgi:tRNA(Ile)-lysidine synthase